MNTLRNHVQLIGRLGQDVKLIQTDSGKQLVNISIATSTYYKDAKGEKQEKTDWHRVTAWGRTAELMDQLLEKGQEIVVQGKLSTRKYEDKNGVTQYITEVVADQFIKLTRQPSVAAV